MQKERTEAGDFISTNPPFTSARTLVLPATSPLLLTKVTACLVLKGSAKLRAQRVLLKGCLTGVVAQCLSRPNVKSCSVSQSLVLTQDAFQWEVGISCRRPVALREMSLTFPAMWVLRTVTFHSKIYTIFSASARNLDTHTRERLRLRCLYISC